MRQLSPMRRFYILALSVLALSGCGFPAPYQTYAPSETPASPPPSTPLIVYGSTTTTPDMMPDSTIIAPVPVPAAPVTAPVSNQVAICYSRLWNRPDTIRTAAVQACGGAAAPRITSQGLDIQACPLLTPTKAVFACSAKTP